MKKRRSRNRRNAARRKKQRQIQIACAVVALFLVCIGIVSFVLYSKVNTVDADTIYNQVYIASVDVSGMKMEEAKKAVEKKVQEYQTQKIALHVENENVEVTLGELGFGVKDMDQLVEKAVNYGKKGNIFSRYKKVRALEKQPKKLKAVFQIDENKTNAVIEGKAQPLEKTATNASIKRENGAFVITDEIKGQKIDAKKSIKEIETYLNKKWDKKIAEVTLVSITDEPKIKRKDLEVIQNRLGTFTTYCGSGGGRVQNIVSGAGHINGKVVMPGEEFSADAAMRPYTTENGFTNAGSYENGQVVQSMGGGICQVSSTLYNAVLLAELEVTQRQPHSMMVGYVKPSRDAAIAGDYKDLKFKNSTKYPIYIEGYVSGGNITFNIYGKETRPANREIEYVSETLSTKPAGKKFEASGAALGLMSSGGSPHTGNTSRLWKIVRENGVEVSREIVNNSTYNSSPTIISVGTASGNAEASALVKAAIASQDEGKINAAISQAKAIIAAANKPAKEPPKEEKPSEEKPKPPTVDNGADGAATE